jgi:hypothetical protein
MTKSLKGKIEKTSTSPTPPLGQPDNYLANRPNDWASRLRASGQTVVDIEPSTDTGKYIVSFVPRKGAPHMKVDMRVTPTEPCPACGTTLQI